MYTYVIVSPHPHVSAVLFLWRILTHTTSKEQNRVLITVTAACFPFPCFRKNMYYSFHLLIYYPTLIPLLFVGWAQQR